MSDYNCEVPPIVAVIMFLVSPLGWVLVWLCFDGIAKIIRAWKGEPRSI